MIFFPSKKTISPKWLVNNVLRGSSLTYRKGKHVLCINKYVYDHRKQALRTKKINKLRQATTSLGPPFIFRFTCDKNYLRLREKNKKMRGNNKYERQVEMSVGKEWTIAFQFFCNTKCVQATKMLFCTVRWCWCHIKNSFRFSLFIPFPLHTNENGEGNSQKQKVKRKAQSNLDLKQQNKMKAHMKKANLKGKVFSIDTQWMCNNKWICWTSHLYIEYKAYCCLVAFFLPKWMKI